MAELTQSNGPENAGGKVRAKKQSTKIDMTPMVDLAFLLLTFFILTTTFLKPNILPLTMPEPVKDPSRLQLLKEKNAFSVVLAEGNKIFWWIGLEAPALPTNTTPKTGSEKSFWRKAKPTLT